MDQRRQSERSQAIAAICRELLGEVPDRIDFPGGSNRKTAIVHFASASYAVSRRRSSERAALEATVLTQLSHWGAPVPRLVASKGRWTIQEYLTGVRLSQALDKARRPGKAKLLNSGVQGLVRIHEAGRRAGLANRVVAIGRSRGWLQTFIEAPHHVGTLIEMPPPELDEASLIERLSVKTPAFIKWDARPGNAIVREDGTIAWFDWEHCGCRSPLDDLAWLLCDEWAPDDESLEEKILKTHLPEFSAGRSVKQARDYLMVFGTLHMCVRLSLILSNKGDGDWWDRDHCLAGDKVGVTREAVRNLCQRTKRWAEHTTILATLSDWIVRVENEIS